jgi:multidrug resistance efflux pump
MTPTSTAQPDLPGTESWADPQRKPQAEVVAAIRDLARVHASPIDRARAMLGVLCSGFGAIAASVSATIAREEVQETSQGGPEGIELWHGALRSAALDARTRGHSIGRVFGPSPEEAGFVLLAAPLDMDDGEPFGGVSILCRWPGRENVASLQIQLRAALIVAAPVLRPKPASSPTVSADDLSRVLARAGSYRTLTEFAYAITNTAKQRFACEHAALSITSREKPRILCISGLDHVNARSPGVHQMEQAMGECLDAGHPIVEQEHDRWTESTSATGGLLHQRWRASLGGGCVLSVPLMVDDRPVGVLSLTRGEADPFDPEEVQSLQKLLTPIAAALPIVQRCTMPLPEHARRDAKRAWSWVMRPESKSKKIAIALAIIATLWFVFKPTMYRVTTPATIIAEREVVVASPLDAIVSDVLVRSGQRVTQGQVLATMDTSVIRVRRDDLRSELRRAELELKQAIAAGDPAAAASARARRDLHAASLSHVEHQIQMASLVAPIDGIVIGPDLPSLAGRLVPVGHPLLSIADEASMSVELEVPERRVTDLHAGATVRFASNARPEQAGLLTLQHIAPAATARQGKPVFVGYGPLPEDQPWLRPGMEGVAMIDAGRKPNWWLATRRLIDAAYLNFWIE